MTTLEQFAELARTLHSQPDAEHTLDQVVQAAVDLIPHCEVAGLSLTEKPHSITSAAATSPLATRSVEIQHETGDGPCVEAAYDHPVIYVPNLRIESRWPLWAVQLLSEGHHVASVMCLQLFTNENRLGALSLYASRQSAFDAEDVDVAIILSAQAAVAFAAAAKVSQLGQALGTRTVIGQAMGLLMHEFQLSAEQSFSALTQLSGSQDRKLVDVARAMVADWESTVHH